MGVHVWLFRLSSGTTVPDPLGTAWVIQRKVVLSTNSGVPAPPIRLPSCKPKRSPVRPLSLTNPFPCSSSVVLPWMGANDGLTYLGVKYLYVIMLLGCPATTIYT